MPKDKSLRRKPDIDEDLEIGQIRFPEVFSLQLSFIPCALIVEKKSFERNYNSRKEDLEIEDRREDERNVIL